MRFAPNIPQQMRSWLNVLAGFAAVNTKGVTVRLTRKPPYMIAGVIYLTHPEVLGYEWDLVGSSFLHELSHARDYVDELDLDMTREQAERRATKAQHAVSPEVMIDLARTYNLRLPDWYEA